ncbi:hypothetical protein V1387_14605 [Allomuricauda taeanensis]|uniref:hypothetical protein n=1 Tax=Flagellimonas taeanensis TaxID=1005926 RepID=UPI002E7AD84B|nr:hypothetical protein [Allomuricauda taeanensis]MEE1963923.1 hypothetical protein [Allomuricauda taeanensis]
MKYDKTIAAVFAGLTILFIAVAMNSQSFFEWVFERHHNQLSWYVRPLFLIPFCYFAYKRSWTGVMATIFALFTSMFWFNEPEVVSEQVVGFLQYEKEWLTQSWKTRDVLMALTVPFSFFLLALAFWKRSLWMGLAVVILMATGKIFWSIQSAGESGKSIVVPAILGLALCFGLILYGFKRLEKKK